jgi:hypothetical protein
VPHPKDIGDRTTLAVTQRDYRGQADAFAVYCRETCGVYMISIEELPLDRAYLRIDAPRNGQLKRVRFR